MHQTLHAAQTFRLSRLSVPWTKEPFLLHKDKILPGHVVFKTQELFKFEYTGEDDNGKIQGEYRSMGLRPYTLEKAKAFGFEQPCLDACL